MKMHLFTSHKLGIVNYIKFTLHARFAAGDHIPSYDYFWAVFQKTLMLSTCKSQELD